MTSEVHTPLPFATPASWVRHKGSTRFFDGLLDANGKDLLQADEYAGAAWIDSDEEITGAIAVAVNERPKLLSRIEQMRAALIEAQKAVKLLEDLTACGADDEFVAALSQQISFALKAE